MKTVRHVILEKLAEGVLSKQDALDALEALADNRAGAAAPAVQAGPAAGEIAIIGMSCRLPMSPDVDRYWDNLIGNRNCFVAKPADKLLEERVFANPHYAEFYDHEGYTPASEDLERFVGAYLEDVDKFDPAFFGIDAVDAASMDPQHRVFLEQAWRALEDAGYPEERIRGSKTGCFVGRDGTNSNYYRHMIQFDRRQLGGIWEGILASRINYHFDLRGPSYVVDTACSASLVAMHMAASALRNGECDLAIAGGITLTCSGADNDNIGIEHLMVRTATPGAVVARDNRIRSFDAKAAGSVFGEGAAAVILKTREAAERDGDHIYGLIAATATNSDGASNGLTAPNPRAQEELVLDAWRRAGVEGGQVDYVETHGTGTPLGDPIEVLGLTNAFAQVTDRKQFCGIGSVKSNIGHTVGAAGAANVIKVLLSMRNEVIPASLNFEEPNPHIDFVNSPIYVVDRNTAWPRRDTARYAGVSGFGFSGTNAHVVLKDHNPPARAERTERIPYVFTVSAKTETAFAAYLARYDAYLNARPDVRLDDLCHSVTTGRGHYAHRLAIVASTMDELVAKFNACRDAGWAENPSRGVFLGSHRVVSDRKTELARGDIQESVLGKLNAECAERIALLDGAEGFSRTMLVTEIARDHVRGAQVAFAGLFDGDVRRVPLLPTYPFDRARHWGEPRTTKIAPERASGGSPVAGPLVTRRVVDAPGVSVYEADLSMKDHWAVKDHVVMSKNLIAGTVLVELVTEALRTHFGTERLALDELMFRTPILVEEGVDAVAQIIVRDEEDGRVSVELVSRLEPGDDEWTLNAKGLARVHHDEPPVGNPTLAELLADPDLQEIPCPELTQFGPTWHSLAGSYQSKSDPEVCYGVIELPEAFHGQIGAFPMHPALLDNAVSVVPFLVYMTPTVYLPMMYSGLVMHRPLPARFYTRSERVSGRRGELMSFRTTLVAEDGGTIATIEQYAMKRVSQMDDFVAGSYYGIGWREADPLPSAGAPAEAGGPVLIVGDPGPAANTIAARLGGTEAYLLTFAAERTVVADKHAAAEPTAEGVAWAVEQLGLRDITRVIDLSGHRPQRTALSEEDISAGLAYGVRGLAALVKGLMAHCKGRVDFTVVADHADEVTGDEPFVDASHAAQLAMIRSLRHEVPNFVFTAVDTDAATSPETLAAECLARVPERLFVALRNGTRYVPELQERPVDRGTPRSADISDDGFYLVTGGAGSLGSSVAAVLSYMSTANFVLTSRRPLPDRAEWAGIVAADPAAKTAQVLANIIDIEEHGSTAELACADVADYAQVKDLVERMRAKYGRLRGIIHGAGVAGDGFLYTKSPEEFDRVLAPKVAGLRNLVHVLGGERPDFIISFSSMTALIGGPGQSDYAAANAFLDAYTLQLRRAGITAKSINWPGWRETGMAHDSGLGDTPTFFDSLTTQSGIAAFNEVLIHDVTGIVPGVLNAEMFAAVGEEWFPFEYSSAIRRAIQRRTAAKAAPGQGPAQAGGGRAAPVDVDKIVLLGKPAEEFTEVERVVAYIYAVVLGLEEIDVFDSFTSLGGNSITATEMLKALNSRFDDVLNISDMFTYSTPEEMAARITELTGAGTAPAEQDGAAAVAAASEATAEESYDEMLTKLESGEIDADSMITYLAGEQR